MGIDPSDDEPRQAGDAPVAGPKRRADTSGQRDRLGHRGRVIAGIAFFLLYAISFSLRGDVFPGLVGGALGGVLVYLVFKEVEERSRRRRRKEPGAP